jgi:diacyltrehalose acyltransferase
MVNRYRQIIGVVATASLLWGVGAALGAVSAAEEAVLIPGATVFKELNPLYPTVAQSYPTIGQYFRSDDDPLIVDYSQDALATNRALRDGVAQAKIAVRQTHGQVVVVGESMGSMVAWRLAEELAAGDDPPDPASIRVVLIAPPEAGAAEYFKEGTFIPILNYTVRRIPVDMPYETAIVIGEYDGWADPPDRPWNLLALANAGFGIAYVHGRPMFLVDPGQVPKSNITVNGNVTTYLVPTPELPLTRPLRDLGVPDAVVDRIDDVLRPIIDAGYVRHDEPGDFRPYLYDGKILFGNKANRDAQDQPQVREVSTELRQAGRVRRANPDASGQHRVADRLESSNRKASPADGPSQHKRAERHAARAKGQARA